MNHLLKMLDLSTEEIIDILKLRGFRFVTVSQLARLRKETIQPGKSYRRFPPE